MKRSDILKKMVLAFEHEMMNGTGDHIRAIDYALVIAEKEGMLPPPVREFIDDSFDAAYFNKWEDESGSDRTK